MPLKIRIYECANFGHEEDRDINSAYQIAFRDILTFKKVIEPKEKKGVLLRPKMKLSVMPMEDF